LNISLRTRRRRTVVVGAVLAFAAGGLAAAVPAQASAGPSATSVPVGGAAAPGAFCPIFTVCTPVPPITPVVTDSLNPSGVTAPDAIVTCATSEIPMTYGSGSLVKQTEAFAIPVGCLTLYNGEWIRVGWSVGGSYMQLTQQTDGNLVLTVSSNGTTTTTPWASGTTFAGNANGPGCLAQFQTNGDLVVDDCDGTSIWDSATDTYPDAVLAFQFPSDLVIYSSSGGTALWSS